MMGLIFVTPEYQEDIQQMKEEIVRMFSRLHYDTKWAKNFVILVAHYEYDIDPRI